MRLLVTADLHFNHPKSRPLAEKLIEEMNGIPADALLLVGDTAVADGDSLEQCLSRFRFNGPKLFIAGNHELWTAGPDSYALFMHDLPRRVRAMGWHWLETEPFVIQDIAITGTIGWYDYSFARDELTIPRRFYEAKISPGAAERLGGYGHLFHKNDDIPPRAMEIVARWNDGRLIKLGRSDETFLSEILDRLRTQLEALTQIPRVIVTTHNVPFAELLPPVGRAQWDFARAFLGSRQIGELLLKFPNVTDVICGHSHFPAEARIGNISGMNIGSGYREKLFRVLDV